MCELQTSCLFGVRILSKNGSFQLCRWGSHNWQRAFMPCLVLLNSQYTQFHAWEKGHGTPWHKTWEYCFGSELLFKDYRFCLQWTKGNSHVYFKRNWEILCTRSGLNLLQALSLVSSKYPRKTIIYCGEGRHLFFGDFAVHSDVWAASLFPKCSWSQSFAQLSLRSSTLSSRNLFHLCRSGQRVEQQRLNLTTIQGSLKKAPCIQTWLEGEFGIDYCNRRVGEQISTDDNSRIFW